MMGAAMLKLHQFVRSLWELYRLVVSYITFVCHLYVGEQGQIQDLIRGAPDHDRPKLATVRSSIVRAKRALFSVGSGAPEALGYFITKYAFSPFWGTFLYYFLKQ